MVWGDFPWHTLGPLVPIEHILNATVYLSIVADHVHPFMDYSVPIFWWNTSSRIMHHVTKLNHLRLVLEHDNEFHFTQMASTVTRSQSNRAPLGCGGTRDSHHVFPNPKSLRNVSNTLLNLCHELAVVKAKRGSNPSTSKVYLIKCVCVCVANN